MPAFRLMNIQPIRCVQLTELWGNRTQCHPLYVLCLCADFKLYWDYASVQSIIFEGVNKMKKHFRQEQYAGGIIREGVESTCGWYVSDVIFWILWCVHPLTPICGTKGFHNFLRGNFFKKNCQSRDIINVSRSKYRAVGLNSISQGCNVSILTSHPQSICCKDLLADRNIFFNSFQLIQLRLLSPCSCNYSPYCK